MRLTKARQNLINTPEEQQQVQVTQQLHPNDILDVEGEFTEETNVQHVMLYVTNVIKKVITVPTAYQDQ